MSLPQRHPTPVPAPPGRLIRGGFNDIRHDATDGTGIRPPVRPRPAPLPRPVSDTQTIAAVADLPTVVMPTALGSPPPRPGGRHRAAARPTRRAAIAVWWHRVRADYRDWWADVRAEAEHRRAVIAEVTFVLGMCGFAIYGVIALWTHLATR